jgi:diguanylate cyclase (GGDEF)-like protein/PAS domain S-box-containing protein
MLRESVAGCLNSDGLSMLAAVRSIASSPRRHGRVLVAAALLFAAIFGARLLDGSATSGLTILYVVPIVFVGVELGRRAGALAGIVALALFAAWTPFAPLAIDATAYVTRGLVFVLVGGVAGHLAERMRAAAAEAQASARHFEIAGDMLCTAGFDGYMKHINGAWEACLGWTREELMSRPFADFVHPDDRERTAAEAARAAAGDYTANFTNRYATKQGDWRWIEWNSRVDPDERLIHAAARDVTERREEDAARHEAEERFRRAFDDSATGMAVVGVAGDLCDVLLDANESLAQILHRTREELIGSHALSERIDPAHAPAVEHGMEELLRGTCLVHRHEYRVLLPEGEHIWLDMTASLVRDDAGAPLYRLVQVLDVTERKTTEERLRYLADHDPLSGVFNRRRFEQELQRELEAGGRARRRSVLLLLDVDHFKTINDTLGHATGDAVIALLGDALRRRLRTTDVLARLGGDEFAVILRRVESAAALEIAHDLRAIVTERLADVVGPEYGPVTISVGMATIGGEGETTADELLSHADRALYAAKGAGRDRVVAGGDDGSAVPLAP